MVLRSSSAVQRYILSLKLVPILAQRSVRGHSAAISPGMICSVQEVLVSNTLSDCHQPRQPLRLSFSHLQEEISVRGTVSTAIYWLAFRGSLINAMKAAMDFSNLTDLNCCCRTLTGILYLCRTRQLQQAYTRSQTFQCPGSKSLVSTFDSGCCQ